MDVFGDEDRFCACEDAELQDLERQLAAAGQPAGMRLAAAAAAAWRLKVALTWAARLEELASSPGIG